VTENGDIKIHAYDTPGLIEHPPNRDAEAPAFYASLGNLSFNYLVDFEINEFGLALVLSWALHTYQIPHIGEVEDLLEQPHTAVAALASEEFPGSLETLGIDVTNAVIGTELVPEGMTNDEVFALTTAALQRIRELASNLVGARN